MAINKQETLPSGLPLSYWRIVSLTCVVNQQSIIEIAGYINQEQRDKEQQYDSETAEQPLDVIVETRFINLDYDPNMSVSKAYEYLKTLPEFSGGEDVIESWAPGKAYFYDDEVIDEAEIYLCKQPHTSQEGWEPHNMPSLWVKKMSDWDEWVQPDSTNPYMAGNKVTHNGKRWISDIDNNVWEPGVYGWTEA
jgi:hypothetical protein